MVLYCAYHQSKTGCKVPKQGRFLRILDVVNAVSMFMTCIVTAKFEENRGDLNERRVAWHDKQEGFPIDLVKRPPGSCWSNVERVGVEYDSYYHRWWIGEFQVLRVQTSCVLFKRNCESGVSQPLELPNFDKCINLRELVVSCACLKALPELGRITSLRLAKFDCASAIEGPGLGSQLSALQELRLMRCFSLSDRLPRLGEVVSLQVLEVLFHTELEVFSTIRTLRRLRELTITYCHKLLQLPQLGELVALEVLELERLPKVRELPDMRLLTKLQSVKLMHVPQLMEQPRLVDLVPSQLRYFIPLRACCNLVVLVAQGCWGGGFLKAELREGEEFLDLSECHELSSSVMSQSFRNFEGWRDLLRE